MFSIRNSANVSEIDIIGSIGEDWWTGEGITLESVRDEIGQIKGDIVLNIASLGGSLIDALAIHDMLKTHQGQVVSNIIGATASAGTIIAMAGDHVKISENSLFLSHKASSGVWGNADDMRKAADDLEKFDSRIIAIYKKKTKKKDEDIVNLMKEDKWITADEALSFGFVDEIYKPEKVLNKADIDALNSIKPLPQNFNNKMENNDSTLKQSILNLVGFKNDAALKAELDAVKLENESLKSQITNSAESATLPLNQKIATLEQELTNKVTEFDALKVQFDALVIENNATKAELAKLQGTPTTTGGSDPIDPQNEVEEVKPLRFQPTNEAVANVLNAAKVRETIKF